MTQQQLKNISNSILKQQELFVSLNTVSSELLFDLYRKIPIDNNLYTQVYNKCVIQNELR